MEKRVDDLYFSDFWKKNLKEITLTGNGYGRPCLPYFLRYCAGEKPEALRNTLQK